MCSDYLPRPTRRIERTTRPLDVALPSYAAIAAVITATNSASSERSGPVTAGAAATGREIAAHFQPIREEALKTGLLNPKVLGVNIKTLQYQVPGGMLSNLVSQLKEAGQEDKYQQVLEEIPRVRKDFGEPPLVTPSSQIVGTQAVLNVLMGERYKMVPKESKKIMLGEFGQTVKPFNPEVQKKIIGDETPITCRPADLIAPQMPQFEKECAQWKQQDEDVLSYALFPNVAKEFFQYREAQQKKVDAAVADKENKAYPV